MQTREELELELLRASVQVRVAEAHQLNSQAELLKEQAAELRKKNERE